MTGLADTVAVVGGSVGIGGATARRLASHGHRVITVDLRDADVVGDLGTQAGRQEAVARVSGLSDGVLDGLVVIPRTAFGAAGVHAGAAVMSTSYFGSVAVLEGLQPALARSGHAAVVLATTWSREPLCWPTELERLCLRAEEDRARALSATIGTMSAHAASMAALARYVRRHALTPAWIGADIRLGTVAPGIVGPLRLSADLNEDQSIRDLERFHGLAEAIADRIVFVLGPEARAFWRSAVDGRIPDLRDAAALAPGTLVDSHVGERR
jgi:NAD(P)-dependent dehydrogenase (short-subunit alcohol dehydrogenase family)